MSLESILNELRSQRSRVDQAIAPLQGSARNSRPAKAGSMKRGHMSAAARARIGAVKKAWWEKEKPKSGAAKKPTPISTTKRKPMCPAARKKLSALMKARWAKRNRAA